MATYHHRIHGSVAARDVGDASGPAAFNWGFIFGMAANVAVWGVVALLIANLI